MEELLRMLCSGIIRYRMICASFKDFVASLDAVQMKVPANCCNHDCLSAWPYNLGSLTLTKKQINNGGFTFHERMRLDYDMPCKI